MRILTTLWLVFMSFSATSVAQNSNAQLIEQKRIAAVKQVQENKLDEAVRSLEEAKKLSPKDISIDYDIAYVRFVQGKYQAAIDILLPICKTHKDVKDYYFQQLIICYTLQKQQTEALKMLEIGLKKFPESGRLHFERGNVDAAKKDYLAALVHYEKGILVEPTYPDNYYWASRIYFLTNEEIWGMFYAEIFRNLESNSSRSDEISKRMYEIYRREIQFPTDSTCAVSFSEAAATYDPKVNSKMPVLPITYCALAKQAANDARRVDLRGLDYIRMYFIMTFIKTDFYEQYTNPLFEYQKQIQEAGHLEAYNYWLLSQGDMPAFGSWLKSNKEKWDAFVAWFNANPMPLSKTNKFHRSFYE